MEAIRLLERVAKPPGTRERLQAIRMGISEAYTMEEAAETVGRAQLAVAIPAARRLSFRIANSPGRHPKHPDFASDGKLSTGASVLSYVSEINTVIAPDRFQVSPSRRRP